MPTEPSGDINIPPTKYARLIYKALVEELKDRIDLRDIEDEDGGYRKEWKCGEKHVRLNIASEEALSTCNYIYWEDSKGYGTMKITANDLRNLLEWMRQK